MTPSSAHINLHLQNSLFITTHKATPFWGGLEMKGGGGPESMYDVCFMMSFRHSWPWDSSRPPLPLQPTLPSCRTLLSTPPARLPHSQVLPPVLDFKSKVMETCFIQWLSWWGASLVSSLNHHLLPFYSPFTPMYVNAHVIRFLPSVHRVVSVQLPFCLFSLIVIWSCSRGELFIRLIQR